MRPKTNVNISNQDIANLLRSVAAAYLIKEENRFKIIAYENAAGIVEHLSREIRDIWQDGKLDQVLGIGPSISSHLDEYFKTGRSLHFENTFKDIPPVAFKLMRVPSIGPKKAYMLAKKLNLKDTKNFIQDLRKHCLNGDVAVIPKFGKKSEDAILRALDLYKEGSHYGKRMPLPYAFNLAQAVLEYLKKSPDVVRVDALGSLRRMVTTIGDVDVAAISKKGREKKVVEYFLNYPKKIAVDNAGDKKASIIVPPQIRVDLRVHDEEGYGSMLQYFTGGKEHNVKLREFALKKGLSLSEYGIKDLKTGKIHKFKDEESFYKFLGLAYIPPEIRENAIEIALALKNKLPKLVEKTEINGDLHLHSSYDLKPSHDFGKNSYVEITKKARELGYEYVGFSDHNPKITGHSRSQIIAIMEKRKKHIESLKSKFKTKYFIGLETDILPNGDLALPTEATQYIDYQIISIHSSFHMDVKAMTARVLRAFDNPKVKIFAHPTGRLIGKRDGYELDWEKIFKEAKKRSIAIEINSWPERLDLPDTLVKSAAEQGVSFIINTDAHANYQMDNMFYGVSVARRGWAKKDDILNTKVYNDFKDWIKS